MIGIIRNRKTFSSAPLAGVLDFLAGERLVNLTGNLARNVLVPAAAILVFGRIAGNSHPESRPARPGRHAIQSMRVQ
mgnify:CR=1 FL=1